MPFLTIDGTPYETLTSGADQRDADVVGEAKRAIDGTLRSSETLFKRNFQFSLLPMEQVDFEDLEALLYTGDFLECGGDAVPTADYQVKIASAGYIPNGTSFLRSVTVTLREV
jgi:hypothetical protein